MGYFSCNAESAIAACDPCLPSKQAFKPTPKKPFKIREFDFSDLQSSTNGFSQSSFLGKGSHGSVYKARLCDGKLTAAVKKTTTTSNSNGSSSENEIEILACVRSPRLVNLLGFAVDSNDRKLIVVEFMPNGSLYDLLHGSTKPPGWTRRVRFALQLAKAVQYLHSSNPPVIHRDIKSSNVLIDSNWNARLGDFGLALRGYVDDARVKSTPPAGTLGYLDPGYLAPSDVSTKSDVFSFGILLLEIISGRHAIDVNYSPPSVVDWAVPLIKSGEYSEICDPRIGPPDDEDLVTELALAAAKCVRSKAEKRPTMSEVVKSLKLANKRVAAVLACNNLGRRMGPVRRSRQVAKYEPLDDNTTDTIKASRNGSRRNRKVSSVTNAETRNGMIGGILKDGVSRSRSIGSTREMKRSPLDMNMINNNEGLGRKKGGLAVKMSAVRLGKSKSMSVLQSTRLIQTVGNGHVKRMEESKLLINDKRKP